MDTTHPADVSSRPILGLYGGGIRPMPGDGRPTAIFKQPLAGRVRIGWEGFEDDDRQADRRVHGGLEKALHHFPLDNYRRLSQAFPDLAEKFVGGAIGENISTEGLDEANACIGDIYGLGTARVQLAQPRSPCWKIDARFGGDGITLYVAEHGLAGWYYRVLTPGTVQTGEAFTLLERNADAVPLSQFWGLSRARRPDPAALQHLADTPGLTPAWKHKLEQRLDWLKRNA